MAQCLPRAVNPEATSTSQAAHPTAAQQSKPSPQQSKSPSPSPLLQEASEDLEVSLQTGLNIINHHHHHHHQTVPSPRTLAQLLSLSPADPAQCTLSLAGLALQSRVPAPQKNTGQQREVECAMRNTRSQRNGHRWEAAGDQK